MAVALASFLFSLTEMHGFSLLKTKKAHTSHAEAVTGKDRGLLCLSSNGIAAGLCIAWKAGCKSFPSTRYVEVQGKSCVVVNKTVNHTVVTKHMLVSF